MASDSDEQRGGDSARGRRRPARAAHVVDAAGERMASYVTDCEPYKRYVNPAICVEHVGSSSRVHASVREDTPHPDGATYRGSASSPHLPSEPDEGSVRSRKLCLIDTVGSEYSDEESLRNDRTYREDGQDTFRLSMASVETSTTAHEEHVQQAMRKKQAFEDWCARKEQERRDRLRLEQMKREASGQPRITPAQREDSFRRWMERKRCEGLRAKADGVIRRFREEEALDEIRRQKEREKEQKLSEWARKKEEKEKELRTRAEEAAARAEAAAARRRERGERAYQEWLRTSKHKPLPVPLNKGELSMLGSVSEMYINPVPWESLT